MLGGAGGAGRSRTADLEFRKLSLYPSELQPPLGPLYKINALFCTCDEPIARDSHPRLPASSWQGRLCWEAD